MAYLLAAVEIHQENRAAFTFKKFPCLCHDFGDKTLEIVLLLEDAARQIQQDLIASVLLDGHFKELRILYANAAKSQISAKDFHIMLIELHAACRIK